MAGGIDLGIDELSDFQAIGRGGFSTIYSAWDGGFNRKVAVKVLHTLDEAGRRRFARERGIMGQLSSHPNVIMPFRAGYTNTGAPYLVMELVQGGSLQDLIARRGAVPWPEAIDLVLPITAALGHAHDQGILHRDVKPGNILLADRGPKLTDFGIAAIRESTTTQVAYTLAHCPPEAFAAVNGLRDVRSDLYAMASTLYSLIAGRSPFQGGADDTTQAYMFRILNAPVPRLPDGLVPEALQAFFDSALAKDPELRPRTAQEFADRLRAIRQTDPGAGAPGAPPAARTDPTLLAPPGGIAPPRPPGTSTGDQWAATLVSAGPAPTQVGPEHLPPWARHSGPGPAPGPAPSPVTSGVGVVPGPRTADPALTSGPGGLIGTPAPRRRSGGAVLVVPLVAVLLLAASVGGVLVYRNYATGSPGTTTTADPGTSGTATSATATSVAAPIASPDPTPVWRFETRSSLSSMPAVTDGILVIGAHVTDTVHAVDAATGQPRWTHQAKGGVDAGPAIANGVVYIGDEAGTMYALGLTDGHVIWQRNLGPKVSGGAAVIGDSVVVGTEDGTVWSLSRTDGGRRWTAPTTKGKTINSTPAAVTRAGKTAIAVGSTDGGLYLLDPDSGAPIDRVALKGGVWFSRPLVLDKPDGSGQEIWIGSSEQAGGFLNRVDVETGQVKSFANPAGVGTSPSLSAEGYILAGNDAGELFAVDRTSIGEVWRKKYTDGNQIKGSPVVHGKQAFIGTHNRELIQLDTADGTVRWRFAGDQIFGLSGPLVVGDQLFAANDSGAVYRFDLKP